MRLLWKRITFFNVIFLKYLKLSWIFLNYCHFRINVNCKLYFFGINVGDSLTFKNCSKWHLSTDGTRTFKMKIKMSKQQMIRIWVQNLNIFRYVILPFFPSHISNNRIVSLEPGIFDNLANKLQVLKLNKNRISTIPQKMFKLPHLQHLWVHPPTALFLSLIFAGFLQWLNINPISNHINSGQI